MINNNVMLVEEISRLESILDVMIRYHLKKEPETVLNKKSSSQPIACMDINNVKGPEELLVFF